MTIDPAVIPYAILYLAATAALGYLIWSNRSKILAFNSAAADSLTTKLIGFSIAISIILIMVAALLAPFGIDMSVKALGAEQLAYIAGAFWLYRKAM